MTTQTRPTHVILELAAQHVEALERVRNHADVLAQIVLGETEGDAQEAARALRHRVEWADASREVI